MTSITQKQIQITPSYNDEYVIVNDNHYNMRYYIRNLKYKYIGYYTISINDGFILSSDFTKDKPVIGLTTTRYHPTIYDEKEIDTEYIRQNNSLGIRDDLTTRNQWIATISKKTTPSSASHRGIHFSENKPYRLYIKNPKAGGRRTKSRRRPRRKNTTKRYKHNS